MTPFDEEKQNKKIEDLRKKEAEDLAQLLSGRYNIPYIDLSRISIENDALKLVPEEKARKAGMAAFAKTGHKLDIAVLSPKNERLKEIFADLENARHTLNLYVASETSLERAWARYVEISQAAKTQTGLIDISDEELNFFLEKIKNIDELKTRVEEVLTTSKSHGVSKILEIILAGAAAVDASDIHLEPEENAVRLRFRLDGVLQDITTLNKEAYQLILSRVKLISSLKLNIKQSAQDGRFTIKLKEAEVEIRTSVIPSAYGETLVLRILNPETIKVSLTELGISPKLLDIIQKEIFKPNGLVLVTGPTGSGKTTTLYTFLRSVNTPQTKIITIEDPIEYHLKGISQTQVNEEKGYAFLEGLRSAVRQDPDIIMVGEIRDKETAKIAINSSLTGHLVFSTLHTNNAAGAIPRLIDLEVNAKVIASAINLILAQRLVRLLCQACKKKDIPSQEEKDLLEKVLGVKNVSEIWRAVGCQKCNGIGYKGRIGIFEGLLMNAALEPIILQNPSEREIEKAARPEGIPSMAADGLEKMLHGLTTLEELRRVIDI